MRNVFAKVKNLVRLLFEPLEMCSASSDHIDPMDVSFIGFAVGFMVGVAVAILAYIAGGSLVNGL